mmetsp:Transcript_37375/g.57268  ORF Transcript_37375/g.57268 Transcript_37375/m.57268 type:complete len:246 (-) Transcript_37375:355-1092(-)
MILAALFLGALDGVRFREDKIYAFDSFSYPGSPWVHQMIIHRSMMAVFQYGTWAYAFCTFHSSTGQALLLMQPFFIIVLSGIFEREKVSTLQLLTITGGFLGTVAVTCPLSKEELHDKKVLLNLMVFLNSNFWGILAAIASNIFGTFNFLAVRRIGKQTHPTVRTLYLGIVGLLMSILSLVVLKPSALLFWRKQFDSSEQFASVVIISMLTTVSQIAVNRSLQEIKAANVASYGFVSAIIFHFGL